MTSVKDLVKETVLKIGSYSCAPTTGKQITLLSGAKRISESRNNVFWYTAPCNGYVQAYGEYSSEAGTVLIGEDGSLVPAASSPGSVNTRVRVWVYVRKGARVWCKTYTGYPAIDLIVFHPSEGGMTE